jgi:hypothetical protein
MFSTVGRNTCCSGHDVTFKKKQELAGIFGAGQILCPAGVIHLAEIKNGCRVKSAKREISG